jgi:hypothetical protein
MIPNDNKTSLLIPSQFPKFVQENADYAAFVDFVQAYYEWMELSNTANSLVTTATTNQGITNASKNILNYTDIDSTTDQFIQYFTNDFLPYFPKDALISPQLAIKTARQLYQSKGTPASYKFLFRVLYNSDFDSFFTENAVLKASGGNWYIPKSLRLETLDRDFLAITNLRLIGEISKSIATIENSIVSGTKTEVFISNIERLFQSGEFASVVDSSNQPVYFYNGVIVSANTPGAETLRAKIVGQISNIKINNTSVEGQLYVGANTAYAYPGDPVVVYGGLSNTTLNPIGATATVGTVTSGSLQSIGVITEGFGYSTYNVANAAFTIINIAGGNGAAAQVFNLDPNNSQRVARLPNDSIAAKINTANGGGYPTPILLGNSTNPQLYHFAANALSNWNTTLANAFNFLTFTVNPISSVAVTAAGGAIDSGTLAITASSLYNTDASTYGLNSQVYAGNLKNMGILAPILIYGAGRDYVVGDVITFTGGRGFGANANVTSVNATGAITGTQYIFGPRSNTYPLGGMGYTPTALPQLNVSSSAGVGAELVVTNVLGDGATFTPVTNKVGSVLTITVQNPGEDYVAAPAVSMRVQDIAVTNYNILEPITNGTIVYQGASKTSATYLSYVDSITLAPVTQAPLQANNYLSTYILRVYNYNTTSLGYQPLILSTSSANQIFAIANNYPFYLGDSSTKVHPQYNSQRPGYLNYGDGNALATAAFLNGLSIGTGQYLDTSSQLSGYDVLESVDYNSYTYQITVEKEIAKYRQILLNLLHPTGINLIGRYSMRSNNHTDTAALDALKQGYSLTHYTGAPASNVTIRGSFTNPSNNILYFQNLSGANLEQIILSNSTISLTTLAGDKLSSAVSNVYGGASNTVVISSNVWLAFANVALVNANTTTNVINIVSLTNSYNIVNNGVYSNTMYPLMDIVRSGDNVLVNNAIQIVESVDYVQSLIYLTANSTSNVSNSFLSVSRTMVANANSVFIFGPTGLQFFPQITTEQGDLIITEDGFTILLG